MDFDYAYSKGTLVSKNLLDTLDMPNPYCPTEYAERISFRKLTERIFVSCDILNPNYILEIPTSDIYQNVYIWDYQHNQMIEDLPF